MTRSDVPRCPWATGAAALIRYHDEEWGVPTRDDLKLFEFLVLEGAQAGLSWATILAKRADYRRAFAHFDPVAVARFGDDDVARLVEDAGIVRNRMKITSAISNARSFLAVQEEFGSFDAYLWRWTGGVPVVGGWERAGDVPAATPLSEALSKDLRRRAFSFVGPTICYAFLQATGVVDDHLTSCFRYAAHSERTGPESPIS